MAWSSAAETEPLAQQLRRLQSPTGREPIVPSSTEALPDVRASGGAMDAL